MIIVKGVILLLVFDVVGIYINLDFLFKLGYLNVCFLIFMNFCFKLLKFILGFL